MHNYKGFLPGRSQGRSLPSASQAWGTASELQSLKGVVVKGTGPPGSQEFSLCVFSVSLVQAPPFGYLTTSTPHHLSLLGPQIRTIDPSWASDPMAKLAWWVRFYIHQRGFRPFRALKCWSKCRVIVSWLCKIGEFYEFFFSFLFFYIIIDP